MKLDTFDHSKITNFYIQRWREKEKHYGRKEGRVAADQEETFVTDISGKEAISKIYMTPKNQREKDNSIQRWAKVISRHHFFFQRKKLHEKKK